ncbi:MAG: acyl-CoA carboxylase epsilon subunit [Candidatus Nanopelagicales bacterium]
MSDQEPRAHLRIVHGQPSAQEIAAVVAVLAAASGGQEPPQAQPTSQWAPPERLMRVPVHPAGWWESALPR